jgi:site-specific DNA-cytosine methylase
MKREVVLAVLAIIIALVALFLRNRRLKVKVKAYHFEKYDLIIGKDGVLKTITVEQAEVLQTLTKGYTDLKGVTKASRYKMIGNGWTVDVIAHFFKCFKNAKVK